MRKCLIVINEISGKSSSLDEKKLIELYEKDYEVDIVRIVDKSTSWSSKGYDLIVACGGDGTFNRAINKVLNKHADVICYSFGTFNECVKAKSIKRKASRDGKVRLNEYALANDRFFSYVLAAGSFTSLGYVVKTKTKKRFGIMAYLAKVLPVYKVHNIKANVIADGEEYDGNYTLIMAIDSMRCFGFNFNKLYRPNNGKIQILLIKSPGKNNFINKIKIFFPFFRAFFVGFKEEYISKNIVFKTVENVSILLDEAQTFNIDGEARVFEEKIDITVKASNKGIYLANPNYVQKKKLL